MNTQLTRWNPFKELDDLQNRIATAWLPTLAPGGKENLTVAEWTPRVDIAEDDHEFLIRAELPEMKKENVKITVEDGVLTIAGERRIEKEEKNKKCHRIEREYGAFTRSFGLPPSTSGEKVTADFKDGVLQIHLPKDAKAPAAKTIEIKAA